MTALSPSAAPKESLRWLGHYLKLKWAPRNQKLLLPLDKRGSPLTCRAIVACVLTLISVSFSQTSPSSRTAEPTTAQQDHDGSDTTPSSFPSAPAPQSDDISEGKQSKRILGIIPNYRAVSADATLPPLSVKGKFVLATQDSFDYSSLLVAGFMAGLGQARDSTPEFHQGAEGYARYTWHAFADQAVGNYFTEFIVPSITRQDPRYYTRFHGNFFARTGYSISRLFVTRTDSGGATFNFSEIIGNGAGAGVSDLYYPSRERTWTKTGQKWVNQVALDGIFNVLKEFWPDVRHAVFRK